jgi:hypothetical protein
MTTQEFITSRTKHDHVFFTAWRVQTETLSDVPEHMKMCRWFPEFGGKIKAVRKVSIQSDMHLPEFPKSITDKTHMETYIEIETDHAIACIVDFVSGAEVGGVIVKGGKKCCSKTLGTWRKYGSKRGHGMSWLRAKFGLGLCKSPESEFSSGVPRG